MRSTALALDDLLGERAPLELGDRRRRQPRQHALRSRRARDRSPGGSDGRLSYPCSPNSRATAARRATGTKTVNSLGLRS